MKRNDDLLKLAFGELSDDAARAVEAWAEPADRKEIETYRNLRNGLQHLPPPPPDTLSAERLRAAILDRELVAKRSSPFAWVPALCAPLALAAVAAVVILPRLQPRPEPQIVAMNDAPLARAIEKPRLDLHDFAQKPVEGSVDVAQAAPAMIDSASALKPVRRSATPRRRPRRPSVVREGVDKDLFAFNVPAPSDEGPVASLPVMKRPRPETIAAPPSTVVESAPGGTSAAETVVIVSTKRDLDTGAPAATEKEASSVLVGG